MEMTSSLLYSEAADLRFQILLFLGIVVIGQCLSDTWNACLDTCLEVPR